MDEVQRTQTPLRPSDSATRPPGTWGLLWCRTGTTPSTLGTTPKYPGGHHQDAEDSPQGARDSPQGVRDSTQVTRVGP